MARSGVFNLAGTVTGAGTNNNPYQVNGITYAGSGPSIIIADFPPFLSNAISAGAVHWIGLIPGFNSYFNTSRGTNPSPNYQLRWVSALFMADSSSVPSTQVSMPLALRLNAYPSSEAVAAGTFSTDLSLYLHGIIYSKIF
jgi:hypothetical protein